MPAGEDEEGLEAIPAIVRATEDEKLLLDALLENLHRARLETRWKRRPLTTSCCRTSTARTISWRTVSAARVRRSPTLCGCSKLSPAVQRRVSPPECSPAGHTHALLSVGLGGAGPAGPPHRGRGTVGAGRRGDRHPHGIAPSDRFALQRTAGRYPALPGVERPCQPPLGPLETRVKVDLGQKKGKITVEFASMDDLERILSSLAPGEGGVCLQRSPG